MSLEALWTIEYQDVHGWVNGGVVVLETGRVFGGDASYFYVGTFESTSHGLSAEVRIVHYHGDTLTAFGDNAQDFIVRMQGQREQDTIVGKMHRVDAPQMELAMRLTRRAELP